MTRLAETFLSAGRRPCAPAELERVLLASVEAGRAAWPDLPLEAEEFVRHLASHIPLEADPLEAIPARHVKDLWLACACASGEPLALAAFDAHLLGDLRGFLARAKEPSDLSEEIRQQLRERLLLGREGSPARIALYSGRGPLATWVRVSALRTAASLRRRRKDHAPLEESDVPADLAVQDPELQILRGRYGEALNTALRDAFDNLPSRDRALLRMHFLDGLNLDRLGVAFQVSRATAGRLMLAVRTRLLDETLSLLGARLNLPLDEVQSLVGALRSKLEVSLRALLLKP